MQLNPAFLFKHQLIPNNCKYCILEDLDVKYVLPFLGIILLYLC